MNIRALAAAGLEVTAIRDGSVPHNGARQNVAVYNHRITLLRLEGSN